MKFQCKLNTPNIKQSQCACQEEYDNWMRRIQNGEEAVAELLRLLNGEVVKETGPSELDDQNTFLLNNMAGVIQYDAGHEWRSYNKSELREMLKLDTHGALVRKAESYLTLTGSGIRSATK